MTNSNLRAEPPPRAFRVSATNACSHCGEILQHAVAFCPYCGFSITAAEPSPSPQSGSTAPAETPQPRPATPVAAQSPPQQTAKPVDPVKEPAAPVARKPADAPKPAAALQPTTVPAEPVVWWTPAKKWVAGIAAAIAVLWWVGTMNGPHQPNPPAPGAQNPTVETYYVVRSDAPVHENASGQSASPATLTRGLEVHGSWETDADGHKWLHLSDGQYMNKYVWEKNLAAQQPPACSTTVEDNMIARQGIQIFASPDGSSPVLGSKPAGSSVYAACKIGDNWIELHMVHGGVGYAAASAF